MNKDLAGSAQRVELLLMDCDGVLTDGRLYFSNKGEEMKAFHVHDGEGIVRWHRAGFKTGVITGRTSEILKHRALELGVHFLEQGAGEKSAVFEKLLVESGLSTEQTAYIGDDLGDLGPLKLAGFPVVVRNCAEEIRSHAIYQTSKNGGFGAVREVVDLLLRLKVAA